MEETTLCIIKVTSCCALLSSVKAHKHQSMELTLAPSYLHAELAAHKNAIFDVAWLPGGTKLVYIMLYMPVSHLIISMIAMYIFPCLLIRGCTHVRMHVEDDSHLHY